MNHLGIEKAARTERGKFIDEGYLVAFACVTALFFLWAIAHNFNDILIKQFQKALNLTRTQSGFLQTAFYCAYFFMALPAGMLMRRAGYKNGILVGLALYALGAILFFPAAEVQSYPIFLFALFVIASGLTVLETAANPYVTFMGDPAKAAQRLNFAQSFNSLGAVFGTFVGGALIFSGMEYSERELAELSPADLDSYRASEVRAVQMPYLALATITTVLAIVIRSVRFPRLSTGSPSSHLLDLSVLKFQHLLRAVAAQFFYVGAQVGVWSYFINFVQDVIETPEKTAANYLGISLILFMIGRFSGTAIMRFVAPQTLLWVCAAINTVLCGVAAFASGVTAVLALGATSFFMSITFPTIFAFGIRELGEHAKIGSSLIVMAIIGGALIPPLMGLIADLTDSIQFAMLAPLICFLVVVDFGWRGHVVRTP